jgi:hypothetical protein
MASRADKPGSNLVRLIYHIQTAQQARMKLKYVLR